MNSKTFKLTLFLTVNCLISAYAQSDSLINRNIRALENYMAAKPIEKVHLHLDRQLYFPGDTIWFKAYVTAGSVHQRSALSRILYAELIGPKDTVIRRLTLGLDTGIAAGDFDLPYDIAPGNYRIRAYSSWMRNAGPDYFYDQAIAVAAFSTQAAPVSGQATSTQSSPRQQAPDKVDLQFFPEGGNLVNGLRSKVAFKAINQNGMAEEVQGSIIDNSGTEVAAFASQHLGMGVFPLEPRQGKQYFAKVTAADGSTFTVLLPDAKNAGFTLSVNNNLADSLYVKVAEKDMPDMAFYLIAQSAGKCYFAASGKLSDKAFTASIAKARFPSGIVQFTLFSETGEPLNERIVFIQNDDRLKLALATDKQNYTSGEQVKFSLEANDPDGHPATGTFSVSVIDENRVPVNENAESTIFTDLLLKSELAGYIQDPNYYFIDPTDQTRSDLDLLMLTQGYHRFEWKNIISGSSLPATYRPEKGFNISGSVTTQHGKPVQLGKVILTATKMATVLDTLTDLDGRFTFANLIFPDSTKVIINAKKANGGENVVLTIDKRHYAPVQKSSNDAAGYLTNHFSLTAGQLRSAYAAWRQDSSGHVIQLKEVKVKDKKIPAYHPDYAELLKHSDNLNGPGRADQVVMGDQLVGCVNILDCLISLVHGGVRFQYHGTSPTIFSVHVPEVLAGRGKPMAVMVDGAILEQSMLGDIALDDVQSVEMLESPMFYSIYGSQAAGGLILITTKRGDEANFIRPLQPGLTLYNFGGFYKAKTFYSPKYTPDKKVTLADNRKTIYWQPNLVTGEDGNASFDYFNAGSAGKYRVVVEGIGSDGKLARQVMQYDVAPGN